MLFKNDSKNQGSKNQRERPVSQDKRISRGAVLAVSAAAALLLPCGFAGTLTGAWAADPTPGSSQGGSPGPSAPAGLDKLSTALPSTISVNNKTERTSFQITVTNDGAKADEGITLTVVG